MRVVIGAGPGLVFERPAALWAPESLDGAFAALQAAQTAMQEGFWIAGAIGYGFGTALHGIDRACNGRPLLLLGAYPPPRRQGTQRANTFAASAPLPRVGPDPYTKAVGAIIKRIRDGEVYQVNYTVPFDLGFRGDPFDLYRFLARRSRARYAAFVEHPAISIASFSPELFLRFSGAQLETKPMKGTAPLDDLAQLDNQKNRAEHLMIVDLLRNDLHRICDDVRVRRLFEIERYPTFATMTSTIAGTLRRRTPLTEILAATFPCGSVTGAPKLAAMREIAARESGDRGFYTGSIGFLSPQLRGWWNVAIRTLQFEPNAARARYDAGGGIVSDSDAAQEWFEVLLKGRFLRPAAASFALLETMSGGEEIAAHVERLCASASAFGIECNGAELRKRLLPVAQNGTLVRVRAGASGASVRTETAVPPEQPVTICWSSQRVRSDDPFLAHKTSWRPAQEAALREALACGCFDALLRNERDEITEGSRTNLFVEIGNTLYTPALECGVLPGILRARLLREGRAVERVLHAADLAAAQALYVGNSARGLLRAEFAAQPAKVAP